MTASSLGRSPTVGTIFILIFNFFSWINLPLSHSQLILSDTQQQRSSANVASPISLKPSSKFFRDNKQTNSTPQPFGKNIVLTKQVCLLNLINLIVV